ncbi:MAG: hypothetical protein U1F66_09880 [bacterium]
MTDRFRKGAWLGAGLVVLALVAACSGGGPGGSGGPVGSALDAGGNYAAGPMNLPAPSIINKNMIYCDNVAGPTVECRGSEGAVPANSRIRLTVYGRFSDRRSWSDWLIPSARAFPGNFDFCNANAAGAFGQIPGDCSVVAVTGEKIGICVASGDVCASPEIVLTVPVEGGTVNGSTGVIKSMGTTPDGYIIFGRREGGHGSKRQAFHWTDLFFGTAHAEEAPTIAPLAPREATCPSNPNAVAHLGPAYQAPKDQFVTLKAQKGGLVQELFRLPGTQDDLGAVSGDNIGNITYISVAMKNTLYVVHRDSRRPMATLVFPAPIKSIRGGTSAMEVLLEVPKGEPSVYRVAADSFDTNCLDTQEANALTGPNSFAYGLANYQPPGEGFRVPIPFSVVGAVGRAENTDDYQVFYRQEEVPSYMSAYARTIYRQPGLMKDLQIVSVTAERVVMAVLDPGANRIIFLVRELPSGDTRTINVSLAGVAESPVAMRLLNLYRGDPYLVLLDSGERGAKAMLIPVGLGGEDPQLGLRERRSVDLGPIVADALELADANAFQWVTFDRVGGQVKAFVLGPRD